MCGNSRSAGRKLRAEGGGSGGGPSGAAGSGGGGVAEGPLPPTESSMDCYTAPFVPVGHSSKASISLCRSRNLVLDTCALFAGRRRGNLSKKFPLPGEGAVRMACDPISLNATIERDPELGWLRSVHHHVWLANSTRDDAAVKRACAPGSPNLVTTPTLFVMRDRHANYAHEMEVLSMVFSFLAALEPKDVAEQGMQVVITDQAPPTGFMETWARISRPHRLRMLAHEPFPRDTCFRSAYQVYTFAAGIGYNTNSDTVRCESPVVTGFSHWLRQHYHQPDPAAPALADTAAGAAARAAGPAAVQAGVRGLRPPTAGIVMKNVVWLSRRNLELVRLLLGSAAGWKAMRMVRNEDAVVAGLVAAVQEWNAESCLLQRFERVVEEEVEHSFQEVHGVHLGGAGNVSAASTAFFSGSEAARGRVRRRSSRRLLGGGSGPGEGWREEEEDGLGGLGEVDEGDWEADLEEEEDDEPLVAWDGGIGGQRDPGRGGSGSRSQAQRRRRLVSDGAGDIDEHGDDDAEDEASEEDEESAAQAATSGPPSFVAPSPSSSSSPSAARSPSVNASLSLNGTAAGAAAPPPPPSNRTGGRPRKPAYVVGANEINLEKLWAEDAAAGRGCRRTNVLFKFVDGDFNDMPYHQQLQIIFRTGLLAGVHGAGLTHGFFLPPGQSAVLQLLGEGFANVAANNVFRNMAAGVGNHYEDVLYGGVDVDVGALKAAAKRAMDFVAQAAMEAQMRSRGSLRLVLDDQSHFAVVAPPKEACPLAARDGEDEGRRRLQRRSRGRRRSGR
ncbi:hypothetical protein HYH03_004658 [Edaphochlamys debaryana]|uniref:Uncharacterized protein n=1 Tax=Edaphochlamys debaryana TaxID=47281 RepID=A0A835Y7K1_9CHLO|nr:hypothetical protein HYH03_004658 [Edaphochlamys debaryana]|eukprot:KAG2497506.1 hypothetical protein HYH03_004658 [Edaphochlamys debaryana]